MRLQIKSGIFFSSNVISEGSQVNTKKYLPLSPTNLIKFLVLITTAAFLVVAQFEFILFRLCTLL
jgi:hypothetical protein